MQHQPHSHVTSRTRHSFGRDRFRIIDDAILAGAYDVRLQLTMVAPWWKAPVL